MRGLIVYEREDAAQNARFIELCRAAAARRGCALELCYADALRTFVPPDADFALLRTRDAALSRRVELAGVRAYNESAVCAMANDKMATYNMLHDIVPMLPVYLAETQPPLPFPFVVKPAGGHGGKNVALVRDAAQYRAAVAAILPDTPLAQPFADPGRDLRVYVIGGAPVLGMLRTCKTDFRSNFSLHGQAAETAIPPALRAMTAAVCARFRLDYAGVDFIWQNGRPFLNEVEDVVGARMVYARTNVPILERYMEYVLATCAK